MIEIFWFMIQEEMSRIMRAEKERVKGEVEDINKDRRDKIFIDLFNNFELEVGTNFINFSF
jgi:hypothetical protein